MVRAGAPLQYPTATAAVSTVFPDFDQYSGPPFELGRMTPSVSDPAVQLQYGLRVGIPDAGQLDARQQVPARNGVDARAFGRRVSMMRLASSRDATSAALVRR